ncbi:putative F-box/FBD/LRR-repeat protein At1g78760 [Panicum virgatum]|uniref:putative F-box/FBD/LRR-repeat protein At1g78760 n=1 Tax=Panicum virgatum TaxID=38727 RepID=UPI0019D677E8|nr:putative F-box/FBD/LRR-repeat protein At1g78760 [Panicum virgatum]
MAAGPGRGDTGFGLAGHQRRAPLAGHAHRLHLPARTTLACCLRMPPAQDQTHLLLWAGPARPAVEEGLRQRQIIVCFRVQTTRSTQRRRRLDLDDEPRRQRQEPPPGGGGGDEEDDAGRLDLDLISRLPDDVLGGVITLLPAKDGARTQILSRRWCPLWRSAPLNLEADSFAAAQAILASHQGAPGRRFSLTWRGHHLDGFSVVDDVLRPPGLDGLQEFELRYSPSAIIDTDFRLDPAPLSVFHFSPTLRVFTVHCLRTRLQFPTACPVLHLPRLEQLTLKGVVISETILHGILSSCLVLQSLVLQANAGYRHLRISSPTLRSLGIGVNTSREGMLEQINIEDAPLLERLFTDGVSYGQQIQVIRAPKLKILGYLSDCVSASEFGIRILKKMEFLSLPNSSAMRTVTILALDVAPDNPDVVVDFLTWFPCVEKLHMAMGHWKMMKRGKKPKNARRHVSLECLDQHLKMLELKSYRGDMWEVSLVP